MVADAAIHREHPQSERDVGFLRMHVFFNQFWSGLNPMLAIIHIQQFYVGLKILQFYEICNFWAIMGLTRQFLGPQVRQNRPIYIYYHYSFQWVPGKLPLNRASSIHGPPCFKSIFFPFLHGYVYVHVLARHNNLTCHRVIIKQNERSPMRVFRIYLFTWEIVTNF